MAGAPRVSVIMNCYNGEKYLRQAIDSVLAQTMEDWELVFWDNQSTDGSAAIVRSYGDSRIHYHYAPSHTLLYEARNHAIAKSRGGLIAFLDVDDWWLPEKLAAQVPLFDDPTVGFACANFWVHSDRKGKRWKFREAAIPTGWVLDHLLSGQLVGLLTLMVRRAALDSLDYPCDPRYHVFGDRDLGIRLSMAWKMGCVQEPIAVYRLHDANETAKHRVRHIEEIRTWLREMRDVPQIRSSPGWSAIEGDFAYLRAMHELLEGRRGAALRVARDLPWGRSRVRVLLAAALPTAVVRHLKN